jgi:hypothetical protein
MSRRWIWIAIALVIGAAALAMLGDVRALPARLGGFQWSAFVAALGLALGNYTIRCARWALYLRRQAVLVRPSTSALVFGAGLSLSITPGKVGALIKSFLLRELHGVPADRDRRASHRPGRAAESGGRGRTVHHESRSI